MLSKRSVFRDLRARPQAYHFFLNALAVGEADSARDLGRVAEHIADPRIRAKVERHYADEQKHGRLMTDRLRELGLTPEPLPPDFDYDQALQRLGYGLNYSRLDDPRPFDDQDLLDFFVGSKVNEERAVAEMEGIIDHLAPDAPTHARLAEILRDEYKHVAYATHELNLLAARGHRDRINAMLRRFRRLEARAHRMVSIHFMERLMRLLGYPALVRWGARLAIEGAYLWRLAFPGRDLEPAPARVPAVGGEGRGRRPTGAEAREQAHDRG
jgi:ferritin-like protein